MTGSLDTYQVEQKRMSESMTKLNTMMLEQIELLLEVEGKTLWAKEIRLAILENDHLRHRLKWIEHRLNNTNNANYCAFV